MPYVFDVQAGKASVERGSHVGMEILVQQKLELHSLSNPGSLCFRASNVRPSCSAKADWISAG